MQSIIAEITGQIKGLAKRVKQLEKIQLPLYEDTTYTPTYLGGTTPGTTTYTAQVGYYIRQGKMVTVWGIVAWNAATGTGNARISLPFSVKTLTGFGVPVTLRFNGVTYSGDSYQGLANTGLAYFEIAGITSNIGPTVTAVEASGSVAYNLVYPID